MSSDDLACPPYALPAPPRRGASILELAAYASAAANAYRLSVDSRADFRVSIRAAGALARATQALTTAIADAVACGDNTLSS